MVYTSYHFHSYIKLRIALKINLPGSMFKRVSFSPANVKLKVFD